MMNLNWRHQEVALGPQSRDCLMACGATAEIMSSRAVQEALEPLALPGRHWRRAEVANVWYTPPNRLLLVYKLESDSGEPCTACVMFGYSEMGRQAGRFQPGLQLTRWNAQAWRMPDDPFGLPLNRWLGPDYNLTKLKEAGVWTQEQGIPSGAEACTPADLASSSEARFLSYLPGQRIAALCPELGVILKHQAGADRSHQLMESLWNLPQRRFQMPMPLAVDPLEHVRWERFVPGHRLEVQAAESGWPSTLAVVTSALVHLHGTSVPELESQIGAELPHIGPATVLNRLNGKVRRRLSHSLPELTEKLDLACQALDHWLPEPSTWANRGLIHGDLHTGNLLIQGSSRSDPTRLHHAQVCFIDLDSLAQGHACVDLALLASRLILQALLGQASAGEVGEAIRKWPYEYAKSSGDETVTRTYPWMVSALLLARQIKTGIRHLAPDMAQISSSLIDLSMAISMRRTMDWNFDECLQRSCEQLKQHRHEDKEAGAARQFNLLTMEASS